MEEYLKMFCIVISIVAGILVIIHLLTMIYMIYRNYTYNQTCRKYSLDGEIQNEKKKINN